MKKKLLPIIGASLWIIGLILFITGLNREGNTGRWLETAGSVAFLAGLMAEGIIWMKAKKTEEKAEDTEEKKQAEE